MIWAVNALNDGRAEAACGYLSFPKEAANVAVSDRYAIHPWELESLVTLLLTTPKDHTKQGHRIRLLDCSRFEAVASVVNSLRNIEDSEYAIFSSREGVFAEMHRIGHRQFAWQRGHFNVVDFYRYSYIYGQGECAEYFKKKYDIEFDNFSAIGAALYILFKERPEISPSVSLDVIDIGPNETKTALSLLSRHIQAARPKAASLIWAAEKKYSRIPLAYRPSILRRFPILSFGSLGEKLIAPLPELIAQRVTSGLYYDLIGGSDQLKNVMAARFEQYSKDILSACLTGFQVSSSYKYRHNKNQIDSPDLSIRFQEKVVAVLECKARKLTVGARYAISPFEQAELEYEEIVKGVYQLWKFFSHVRGIAASNRFEEDVIGIVLTLDPWLQMSRELVQAVHESAKVWSEREDQSILAIDQRPIVVCSIEELERTLLVSDEQSFMETIKSAASSEYAGWLLYNVHRDIHKELRTKRRFPFELAEVLPWKKKIDRLAKLIDETS